MQHNIDSVRAVYGDARQETDGSITFVSRVACFTTAGATIGSN